MTSIVAPLFKNVKKINRVLAWIKSLIIKIKLRIISKLIKKATTFKVIKT
jgi:hypothetical protein